MTDLTVTPAKVGRVDPQRDETITLIGAAIITAGQPVYQNSSGRADLADASLAGTAGIRGIAMNSGGIGQAITVLKRGGVEGYDLSGVAYDGIVYLSDTAGALADAPGTVSTTVGRVIGASDNDISKYLYVDLTY